MSLEAWGDEVDSVPEGYVTEEYHREVVNEAIELLELLMNTPKLSAEQQEQINQFLKCNKE